MHIVLALCDTHILLHLMSFLKTDFTVASYTILALTCAKIIVAQQFLLRMI